MLASRASRLGYSRSLWTTRRCPRRSRTLPRRPGSQTTPQGLPAGWRVGLVRLDHPERCLEESLEARLRTAVVAPWPTGVIWRASRQPGNRFLIGPGQVVIWLAVPPAECGRLRQNPHLIGLRSRG